MEQTNFTEAKKSRTAHLSQLTRLYKELDKQLLSHENSEKAKGIFERLCDRYEQFKSAHLVSAEL